MHKPPTSIEDFHPEFLEEWGREDVITMNKAQCPICMDVVESVHVHDYRSCGCGAISVDGGKQYIKRSWKSDLLGEKKIINMVESARETDAQYLTRLQGLWTYYGKKYPRPIVEESLGSRWPERLAVALEALGTAKRSKK